MKKTIVKSMLVALVVGSPILFAQSPKSQPVDPTAATSATATTQATAKMSHKDAKKKCLEENSAMKGKSLRECIKNKMAG